jgi:hypothetical protein
MSTSPPEVVVVPIVDGPLVVELVVLEPVAPVSMPVVAPVPDVPPPAHAATATDAISNLKSRPFPIVILRIKQ